MLMKKSYTLLFLLFAFTVARAQYTRYVVILKDKKGTTGTLSNPSAYLSPKALERRNKQKISIDSTDLPVSAAYLDSIRAVPNVTIRNVSKWLNQVLIITSDANAISRINAFPFVKTAAPVAAQARPMDSLPRMQKFNERLSPLTQQEIISGTSGSNGVNSVLNYGNSYNQIHLHEGDYLHDLGFTGKGITIAILDAGFFGYKTNTAMDSVRLQNRILGEWDYVANEASVTEDHPHGLYCFSIIAANKPGQIVGSAPHASFYLLRTEDAATEYPVEEQNWVAAAEFADSVGVDMITSSLGYADFDDPSFNHTYAQRDGNTAIVTRGADLAVKKGIIVTNSAGNSGNAAGDAKYVACPADGDSVFTVGATTQAGVIASFSSWGPNGVGKQKPDITSVGQGTVLANTLGNASSGNGTSFSNPLACGLIACLWQAFPEFTNMEILDAVKKSSSLYPSPDMRYGYGLPNFRKAYEMLAKERESRRVAALLGDQWLKALPVPFHNQFQVILKAPVSKTIQFRVFDAAGHLVDQQQRTTEKDQIYIIEFFNLLKLKPGAYFIQYNDGSTRTTLKVVKQ